ncbi:hypothetical protein VTN31DRAFT_2625 [Thermomyces dupontii]|uniref:uncharacterized protein n=1 Tax=Talaromyces thermophilus TaxID=28565 RepID=UPI0037425867
MRGLSLVFHRAPFKFSYMSFASSENTQQRRFRGHQSPGEYICPNSLPDSLTTQVRPVIQSPQTPRNENQSNYPSSHPYHNLDTSVQQQQPNATSCPELQRVKSQSSLLPEVKTLSKYSVSQDFALSPQSSLLFDDPDPSDVESCYSEPMYTSVNPYFPTVTSNPGSNLLNNVHGQDLQRGTPLDAYQQGNRPPSSLQNRVSWMIERRPVSEPQSPVPGYDNGVDLSLTPPAAYTSLPSQSSFFPNPQVHVSIPPPQEPILHSFHPSAPSTPSAYNYSPYSYPFPQVAYAPMNPSYPVSGTSEVHARIPSDPPSAMSHYSTPTAPDQHRGRVVESRPKPQCWDHGCNGREFSTFSNLLRHQRERSGAAAKSKCPHCGAVFTRSTARNTHMAQGKCKANRISS